MEQYLDAMIGLFLGLLLLVFTPWSKIRAFWQALGEPDWERHLRG